MWWIILALPLVVYLPGALIFRLPVADRAARAALAAEERLFWAVVISITVSCAALLALAAFGLYSLPRLLGVNAVGSLALVLLAKGDLKLGPAAAGVRAAALIPAGLVALGFALYLPPSEFAIGGRDPGVYLNQGIQLARDGSWLVRDPLVSAMPDKMQPLFFPRTGRDGYATRIMGFKIHDAQSGVVGGQFPQLYPASIAIAYGFGGLRGALGSAAVWAILGLLAFYFAGAWHVGKPAATAAAALLGLHVAQTWFARLPNSELPLQALLFAGLLAFGRMEHDRQRFFGPVAAGLFGAMCFLRYDAWIVTAVGGGTVVLLAVFGRRPSAIFVTLLALLSVSSLGYALTVTRPYALLVFDYFRGTTLLQWSAAAAAACAVAGLLVLARRHREAWAARLPILVVLGVLGAALYAYGFREPGGRLAPHDAWSLRLVTDHYLTRWVLAAALAGFAVAVPRLFWKGPLFVLVFAGLSGVFFYKTRITPEHFWMARRLLPVILPGILLFAAAAFFHAPWPSPGRRAAAWLRARTIAGIALAVWAGWHFAGQTRPILAHVEYAGAVSAIERLAARVGADDLVVMESRGASDVHILGLPLMYAYGRQVLVLDPDQPEEPSFEAFYQWASARYPRVFFVGSGGTQILSRTIDATPVAKEAFSLPEYDRPWYLLPHEVRYKAFAFGVYRLGRPQPAAATVLAVGGADDFRIAGFYGRERADTTPYRWSSGSSVLRLRVPTSPPARLTIWAGNGRRPSNAPEARVSAWVGTRCLGTAVVGTEAFQPFAFDIPAEVARAAAEGDGFLNVRLETQTWSPRRQLGSPDARELGVMVTRVELR